LRKPIFAGQSVIPRQSRLQKSSESVRPANSILGAQLVSSRSRTGQVLPNYLTGMDRLYTVIEHSNKIHGGWKPKLLEYIPSEDPPTPITKPTPLTAICELLNKIKRCIPPKDGLAVIVPFDETPKPKTIDELFDETVADMVGMSFKQVRTEFQAAWAQHPTRTEKDLIYETIEAINHLLLGPCEAREPNQSDSLAAASQDSKKSPKQKAIDDFCGMSFFFLKSSLSQHLWDALMPPCTPTPEEEAATRRTMKWLEKRCPRLTKSRDLN
jgi:hypothetical protein